MNILSLFDGISCARVALDRAGIPVEAYYASEIKKEAIQVSKDNYPDIIELGDITNICHTTYLNNIRPIFTRYLDGIFIYLTGIIVIYLNAGSIKSYSSARNSIK